MHGRASGGEDNGQPLSTFTIAELETMWKCAGFPSNGWCWEPRETSGWAQSPFSWTGMAAREADQLASTRRSLCLMTLSHAWLSPDGCYILGISCLHRSRARGFWQMTKAGMSLSVEALGWASLRVWTIARHHVTSRVTLSQLELEQVVPVWCVMGSEWTRSGLNASLTHLFPWWTNHRGRGARLLSWPSSFARPAWPSFLL